MTVQSQLCGILIATLSYSHFEIIQLQRIESAANLTYRGRADIGYLIGETI